MMSQVLGLAIATILTSLRLTTTDSFWLTECQELGSTKPLQQQQHHQQQLQNHVTLETAIETAEDQLSQELLIKFGHLFTELKKADELAPLLDYISSNVPTLLPQINNNNNSGAIQQLSLQPVAQPTLILASGPLPVRPNQQQQQHQHHQETYFIDSLQTNNHNQNGLSSSTSTTTGITTPTSSPLETRNDQVYSANVSGETEVKKRNYFRVFDRVFSRVDMPQVFRSPKSNLNAYCANFIGCIDDIPGLPAILRRSNISSTFTVYTSARPQGVRIMYEPLLHHQLGDANLKPDEIATKIQQSQQKQHQYPINNNQLQQHQLFNNRLPLTTGSFNQQQNRLITTNSINGPFQQQNNQQQQQQQSMKLNRQNIFIDTTRSRLTNLNGSKRRMDAANNAAKVTAKSWQSGSILKRVQEYPFDLSALESTNFNRNENTRIIIGGYFAKEDEHWIEDLVGLWRQLEPNANIIKVSWPDANRGLYHSAALNSRVVGRQLSLFLHYLNEMYDIDLGSFHLVGHSLGAHIAGFVGTDNGGRVGRITGLDPAGPIFVDMDESMRLDPSDANFVDVVHTNAGSITKGALGLSTPSGHIDYYPNGGSVQPGCYSSSIAIMDPVERVACNHRRSYRYFIEILRLTIEQQSNLAKSDSSPGQTAQTTTTLATTTTTTTTQTPVILATRNRRQKQQALIANNSIRPTAFLFEAKEDELDRLTTPDFLCLDSKFLEPKHRSIDCDLNDLPTKRLVEFHRVKVDDFPKDKRGLYFLRTRPEAPFFGSRQYGVTLRTSQSLKRKISISLRLDKSPLPDLELDQIESKLTLLFVPTDVNKFNLSSDLWFMWRYRSFSLLSSLPDELTLSGLELLELESSPNPSVIKYIAPNITTTSSSSSSSSSTNLFISNSLRRTGSGNSEWPALIRNRWYKFERS